MAVNLNHPGRRPQKPWTPELERRHLVIEDGRAPLLGRFLDHLDESGIVLARWSGAGGCDLAPLHQREEKTLADFFGLDLDKIESEKLALLRYVRACHDYDAAMRERAQRAVAHYNDTMGKVST